MGKFIEYSMGIDRIVIDWDSNRLDANALQYTFSCCHIQHNEWQ